MIVWKDRIHREVYMKLISNALIRLTEKSAPQYDPEQELIWNRDYNSSSWFVIGHFEANGHRLNYLYHLMVWNDDKTGEPLMNSVVSVTDETTGVYHGEDKFYSMSQTQISEDHFGVRVPNGSMEGDLKKIHFTASMENVSLDIDLDFGKEIIFNGGGGRFFLANVPVQQYSKPVITPSGTLTLDGREYPVSGEAWFDRQWQKLPQKKNSRVSSDPVADGTIHWYWMDLNLDCGDKLSLWCVEIGKITRAWATVLDQSGRQDVVEVVPFSRYPGKKWKSPASGQNYPIEYTVNIPERNAHLTVMPFPVEQEIASEHINKYEAASQISGIYQGKPAKGFCYVELVGSFK